MNKLAVIVGVRPLEEAPSALANADQRDAGQKAEPGAEAERAVEPEVRGWAMTRSSATSIRQHEDEHDPQPPDGRRPGQPVVVLGPSPSQPAIIMFDRASGMPGQKNSPMVPCRGRRQGEHDRPGASPVGVPIRVRFVVAVRGRTR